MGIEANPKNIARLLK